MPTLTEALDIFEENLTDIKEALLININYDLDHIEPIPLCQNEFEKWLWQELHKLEIEKITGDRVRIINRINSRLTPPATALGRITEDDIARANEYPIQELFEGRLFKAGGRRLTAHCPFHSEKTPSFYIHLKDNRWSCFGSCNEHGSPIDFYMKMRGVNFIQAVKELSR